MPIFFAQEVRIFGGNGIHNLYGEFNGGDGWLLCCRKNNRAYGFKEVFAPSCFSSRLALFLAVSIVQSAFYIAFLIQQFFVIIQYFRRRHKRAEFILTFAVFVNYVFGSFNFKLFEEEIELGLELSCNRIACFLG